MKFSITVLLISLLSCASYGQEADSSALIFDDTKIYSYELEFYISNWEETLKYNYENGEEYMPARLKYGDMILDSIGVRYKGNSSYSMSLNTSKKPLKFKFDKYIDDQTFFGLNRLNFSNCVQDPSFMREKIAYDIARKFMPAPRAVFANIYIHNELIGFYVQVEQVDKTFLSRYFEDNSFNLYKAGDEGAFMIFRGTDQSIYEDEYELKTNEDLNDWTEFINLIDKLNNTPASVFKETLQNYLNLDNVIRHLAFNMVFSHFDSYTGSGRNFYFYDDQVSGQFNIIPWDFNETFGAYTNNWDVITQDVINISNLNNRPLNKRILENDSLRQVYLNYIKKMINGCASYDSVAAKADRIKPFIENHVQADNNKLYSYQNFIDNITNEVFIGMGIQVPGIKSFSQERNENLLIQISQYFLYTGDLVINEFMASNDTTIADQDGEYDDWIELYNNSNSPIFLSGYYLSDDENILTQWAFPDTSIQANGYLIIWADKDENQAGLHTNFELPVSGGTICLVNPDISIVDKIVFGAQTTDLCSGRYPNGTGSFTVVNPSFAAINQNTTEDDESIPDRFILSQNYPNPFNPKTTIKYYLPKQLHVCMKVYNIRGRLIKTLFSGRQPEGNYELVWNGTNEYGRRVSSGIYFYNIITDNFTAARKMILLK